MAELPLTGGCLCGAVRFEVDEQPTGATYCHCTRCQRRTGSAASAQAIVVPGSVRIVSGDDVIRAYVPSDGSPKAFCSLCGTHLWAKGADGSPVAVRMSAFDDDPGVRPSLRQFVAYAAAWEPIPDDGLPRYPERRPTPG